ncbi:hypothetical protein BKA70DRAFT_1324716 [Coprinopsis sp. MPI-PUGE-AT-0042]|nr:hypothetical protein BKA70DRAFT_1324716 [Coprinopsis sp. MPI-PUGE-AT-0042]
MRTTCPAVSPLTVTLGLPTTGVFSFPEFDRCIFHLKIIPPSRLAFEQGTSYPSKRTWSCRSSGNDGIEAYGSSMNACRGSWDQAW